jgi:rSAM/selenodomain-associated transferase 2
MISIIIPTYNEEHHIAKLVEYLRLHNNDLTCEIIVVDAGSNDNTLKTATAAGAKAVVSPIKGRASQMNYGASIANGDVFYFVHADSFPPATYISDINQSIKNGFEFGRYRTKFDSKKWILKINAFFTRFDFFICYGGDQTLFITKKLFDAIGGFNPGMKIMEDYEIVTRAKAIAKYKIIKKDTLVSARKYDTNSWLTVQLANNKIVQMYKKGASQQEMADMYKKVLNYR